MSLPDNITPEQMESILTLMKATGRNSYSYLSRSNVRRCQYCGEVFETKGRGRPKKFCSDECRLAYNHKNPHPENWKSTRTAICPVCGKPFIASKEYKQRRIYCSHACANRGRAMKKKEEMGL